MVLSWPWSWSRRENCGSATRSQFPPPQKPWRPPLPCALARQIKARAKLAWKTLVSCVWHSSERAPSQSPGPCSCILLFFFVFFLLFFFAGALEALFRGVQGRGRARVGQGRAKQGRGCEECECECSASHSPKVMRHTSPVPHSHFHSCLRPALAFAFPPIRTGVTKTLRNKQQCQPACAVLFWPGTLPSLPQHGIPINTPIHPPTGPCRACFQLPPPRGLNGTKQ